MASTVANPRLRKLLSADQIATRVAELGDRISDDYADKNPILVCILKGSMPFFVDLAREIHIPARFDYLAVESYRGTSSTGVVKFTADLSGPIEGRHVLLVEDIVDTGLTMSYLFDSLGARRPASLVVVTLLDKLARRQADIEIAYWGFRIPDEFVVGYGLDYEQYFRNLPYVAVLEELPVLPAEG